MRLAAVAVLAACGPQWKEKTTVEPEPESVQERAIEIPSRDAAPRDQHELMMNGPVVIPPGSQPCPATPNATQASIRLTFVNQTTFQADLCAEADRALGQLADLGTLVAGGFRLNVSLESLKVQGKYLYGSVGMRLQALSGDIGTEFALSLVPAGNTPLAQSFAVADVVQDAIEDLIKNSVGPTMKRLVPRPAPP